MELEIRLCQYRPAVGDVKANLAKVVDSLGEGLTVFPELFLSGYGADYAAVQADVQQACGKLEDLARETGKGIIVGAPSYSAQGVANSLYLFAPDRTYRYDKMHLPDFGEYSESGFVPGENPVVGFYMGMGIGLGLCYDIFYPELYRTMSLYGAVVNVCCSASAERSRPYFEKVLPARALENTSFTVFCNNVGEVSGHQMFGGSRVLGPLGDPVSDIVEGENMVDVKIDVADLGKARVERPHLEGFRNDFNWFHMPSGREVRPHPRCGFYQV